MSNRQSIAVVGGLFSSAMLDKVASQQADHQALSDYGLPEGLTLRDEIARSWRAVTLAWGKWEELPDGERNPEHFYRKFLQVFLKHFMGYDDLAPCAKPVINEFTYPIHYAALKGQVPVLVVPVDADLDKGHDTTRIGQQRRSPAAVIQQYLNVNDKALYGLVTNGSKLRLYRDNPMFTRPAYVEFDLERMIPDKDGFSDYSLMWLFLHATRLAPQDAGLPDTCWLETWNEQAAEEGERAQEALRQGVADALRALGTGFLEHPSNKALLDKLEDGSLTRQSFYQQLLRLVYRFIFLATTEGRDLLMLPYERNNKDRDAARSLYLKAFALTRLRDRARRIRKDRHHDLWEVQKLAFKGLRKGEEKLALPGLGGLFASDQCQDLESLQLSNTRFIQALHSLMYFKKEGLTVPVDYRGMDTEELGSVYEGLLELVPMIRKDKTFGFAGDDGLSSAGNQRKLTGSYYTPSSLVAELVKSALEPVIADRKRQYDTVREAILSIRMIDPACGSGHFLLAAGRVMAAELASSESESGQPSVIELQHAMREVVQNCLFGVDLNPMAVELCKTALWLESVDPGKPMTFLDAHIRNGNALIGLLGPMIPEDGIAQDAFKDIPGVDDKAACKALRDENSEGKDSLIQSLAGVPLKLLGFDNLCKKQDYHEETPDDVELKRLAFEELRNEPQVVKSRTLADAWVAAYTLAKTTGKQVPTNKSLQVLHEEGSLPGEMTSVVASNTQAFKPFHWHLEFSEVMEGGGFDVVLANPPWEKMKVSDEEFFKTRVPEVADAANSAARKRMIKLLRESDNEVERQVCIDYDAAIEASKCSIRFVTKSDAFPLAGKGDVDLYPIFAERILAILRESGRAGFIAPTGLATNDGTKELFAAIIDQDRLVSLFDFENKNALFKIHRSYKFSLVTVGITTQAAKLSFYNFDVEDLTDERRLVALTPADFKLVNPNTKTAPLPRTPKDWELLKKIYGVAPALLREGVEDGNPWGFKPSRMFDMSNDSHLFLSADSVAGKAGWRDLRGTLQGNRIRLDGKTYLPLYEGKMIHHYDHRFATYGPDGVTDSTPEQKADPNWEPMPQYWVDEWWVYLNLTDKPSKLKFGKGAINTADWFKVISIWCAANLIQHGQTDEAIKLLRKALGGDVGSMVGLSKKAAKEVSDVCEGVAPLSAGHLKACMTSLDGLECGDLEYARQFLLPVFQARSPEWLMGWRDIARGTDERTIISTLTPVVACNNKFPIYRTTQDVRLEAALVANFTSLIQDFAARQKIPGTTINLFLFQQLSVLTPDCFSEHDLDYIASRVVSLQFISESMRPWAEALTGRGVEIAPGQNREQKRAELDAYFAHLYGLTREDLEYILDPELVMGSGWPSVTFPGLKNNENSAFGEYRTQRLVLQAYDELARTKRVRAVS